VRPTPELQTKLEHLIYLYTQVNEENPNNHANDYDTLDEQISQFSEQIITQVHEQIGPLFHLLIQARLITIFDGHGKQEGWQRPAEAYLGPYQGSISFELETNE
jgi:hypothetical protein